MNGNPQYDTHRNGLCNGESGSTRMGDPVFGDHGSLSNNSLCRGLPHETNGVSVLYSTLKEAAAEIDKLMKENRVLKQRLHKYESKEKVQFGW